MANNERAATGADVQILGSSLFRLADAMAQQMAVGQAYSGLGDGWRALTEACWTDRRGRPEGWEALLRSHIQLREALDALPGMDWAEATSAILARHELLLQERIELERSIRPPRRWRRGGSEDAEARRAAFDRRVLPLLVDDNRAVTASWRRRMLQASAAADEELEADIAAVSAVGAPLEEPDRSPTRLGLPGPDRER